MRAWMLVFLLAGCLSPPDEAPAPQPAPSVCSSIVSTTTLWFAPDFLLAPDVPADGSVFSNGFDEAFLTDDMDEWRSHPASHSLIIVGNVTLEFWVQNDGTPAPVVIGGAPGEGYHWFNQFGSTRGFVEDYGREYAPVAPEPGSIDHYVEVIQMPPGGLHVETGDALRVLLTSLVVDDSQGRGQQILYGESYPSSITFQSVCMPELTWVTVSEQATDVEVAGNQGLITGAVPAQEDVNFAEVPFTLEPQTQRLAIGLAQSQDTNPLKDDMDLTIHDDAGTQVASIGSPYSDEFGTFYAANLVGRMPPGDYTVRVNSYSGHDYTGTVTVTQDRVG